MKNLWKLFAVSALALVPATAYAEEATMTGNTCVATSMETLEKCNVKKVGEVEVKAIQIAGNFEITKNITINVPIELTAVASTGTEGQDDYVAGQAGTLTIAPGVKAVINGEVTVAGEVTVKSNATLEVHSKEDTAVTASKVNLLKGKMIVTADNSNKISGKENDAVAITGSVEADGGVLEASIVTGTIKAIGKSSITVEKSGKITAADTTNVVVSNTVSGAELTDKATLKAKIVDGNLTAEDDTKVTVSEKIDGTVTAEDNANVVAKTITDAVTVGAVGAKEGSAYVQYASATSDITVNRGIAKAEETDAYGDKHIEIRMSGISNFTVGSNETWVIENGDVLPNDLKVTAYKGAVIKNNQTSGELNLPVNNGTLTVKATEEAKVENGQEQPTDPTTPTDPTNPTDPDKVPDVPKTGDTVLVSSALGLVSLVGLAATVKSRKFN